MQNTNKYKYKQHKHKNTNWNQYKYNCKLRGRQGVGLNFLAVRESAECKMGNGRLSTILVQVATQLNTQESVILKISHIWPSGVFMYYHYACMYILIRFMFLCYNHLCAEIQSDIPGWCQGWWVLGNSCGQNWSKSDACSQTAHCHIDISTNHFNRKILPKI